MKKYQWIGIGAVILALGISAVHAKGHQGKHHRFGGHRLEALGLTQDQKDQLKSLRTENHKKMIQLKADAQLAHVELRELMSEKNPNQSIVDKTVEKINVARSKMMESRVQMKLSVNKILTDKQFQKFEEMPRGRRDGPRQFRGHLGGGRGMGMGWHTP